MLSRVLVYIFLHSTLLYSMTKGSPLQGKRIKVVEDDEFGRDFAFAGSLGEFSRGGVHKKWERHYCGGALISKRHVLTAAHCLKRENFYGTMVTFGSTDLNRGNSYEMKEWITYKAWANQRGIATSNIEFYDDIAIITLSSDVNGITPAVVSKLHDNDVFEQEVEMIGWGNRDDKTFERPQKMQKAHLRVLKPSDCDVKFTKIFGPGHRANQNEFCTHADPPVILGCGDSGGPLVLNRTKEIVGVSTSHCDVKKPLKNPNTVNMHIKVSLYKRFINDVTNSQ